jgi:hypothetical protein
MTYCELLHLYEQFNVTIMYGVSSCEPSPRLLPSLAKTTSSYFVLVVVNRPGLQVHQISRPLTTSCWEHVGYRVYRQTSQARHEILKQSMQPADRIGGEKMKLSEMQQISILRCAEICILKGGDNFEQ